MALKRTIGLNSKKSINVDYYDLFAVLTGHHSCSNEPYSPACDTDGRQHSNLCALHRREKILDYLGPCQVGSHIYLNKKYYVN